MQNELKIKAIAHIRTEFPDKFGIPRQSGLVEELRGEIVFEPEYRFADALRGIEGFSHIWLLWEFSECLRDSRSLTVRPPRLGGNERVGVFATRSPFRPNPIGLSCVRLEKVELNTREGPIITVRGADLMDGTPIFDIKPYLPHADCRTEATGGFSQQVLSHRLRVNFPDPLLARLPADRQAAVIAVLEQDPRPGYHNDPERIYGFTMSGYEIRFTVDECRLTVVDVEKIR